jgi:hypothetical protein
MKVCVQQQANRAVLLSFVELAQRARFLAAVSVSEQHLLLHVLLSSVALIQLLVSYS